MACLDDNTLAELVDGSISAADRGRVQAHIDGCPSCRELVATLAPSVPSMPAKPSWRKASADESLTEVYVRPDADEPLLRPGLDVDEFRVIRCVARGGMGDIYLAQDVRLARKVALKVIRPELFNSHEAMVRFQHEARAMARVAHPNLVAIHTVGEFRGMPYVAMEYVEGETLAQVMKRRALGMEEVVAITTAIAEALMAAHDRGVVHRDLKPDNVIVGEDGRVRVLDFGLARVGSVLDSSSHAPTVPRGEEPLKTVQTSKAGTPFYMAPEQWEGAGTTPATDVWALGVIIYELLFREHPFAGAPNVVELGRMICSTELRTVPAGAAHVPPALERLALQCLDRDAHRRPSLAELLDALAQPTQAPALEPPAPLPPRPRASSTRTVVLVVVALMVGVVIGVLAIAL